MISYRDRAENIVYEISNPTKWGFRPYALTDLNTGFNYWFKLLNEKKLMKIIKMIKMEKCFIWLLNI